jgi:RodZ C-terminal domain
VLVASRGPCWLSVHISSAAGRTVFERTLQPSQTARFTFRHRHLWMRIGAPWNLDAILNGRTIRLSGATATSW